MESKEVMFVLADDNMLYVHDSSEVINGAYEGIDVENEEFKFFDKHGNPLIAMFDEPNQQGKIVGSLGWVGSGKYHLVPDKCSSRKSLIELMDSISGVEGNSYFRDLSEIHSFVSMNTE